MQFQIGSTRYWPVLLSPLGLATAIATGTRAVARLGPGRQDSSSGTDATLLTAVSTLVSQLPQEP